MQKKPSRTNAFSCFDSEIPANHTFIQQDFHRLQSPSEHAAIYPQSPDMQPSLQYLSKEKEQF